MTGQSRLHIVKLARPHGFHQRGRDGRLAGLVARFQRQGQGPLDLKRCAQLGGQDVDGRTVQDRLGISVLGRAGTEQPQDYSRWLPATPIEREDVGPVADFLHCCTAQIVAQLRMAGQSDGQSAARVLDHFHQAFATDEGVAVQVVRLVDEQRHRPLPLFDDFLQFTFALLTLLGDLHLLVLRQVVVQRGDQSSQLDAVLFHGQRFGDGYAVLVFQNLLKAAKRYRLAATDDTAQGDQPSLKDRALDVIDQQLVVVDFVVAGLAERLCQPVGR